MTQTYRLREWDDIDGIAAANAVSNAEDFDSTLS